MDFVYQSGWVMAETFNKLVFCCYCCQAGGTVLRELRRAIRNAASVCKSDRNNRFRIWFIVSVTSSWLRWRWSRRGVIDIIDSSFSSLCDGLVSETNIRANTPVCHDTWRWVKSQYPRPHIQSVQYHLTLNFTQKGEAAHSCKALK